MRDGGSLSWRVNIRRCDSQPLVQIPAEYFLPGSAPAASLRGTPDPHVCAGFGACGKDGEA